MNYIEMRSLRGIGLLGTLVTAVLIFILALAISGAGLFHLNLSSRSVHESHARNLAESAVSKMIERVMEKESSSGLLDYGQDGTGTFQVVLDGTPADSFGLATFRTDHPDVRGATIHPCLNNLTSDSAIEAVNGSVVPKGSLYLVGFGFSGGVTRKVEAVVRLPRFPYAVFSEGPFTGTDIVVAGIPKGESVLAGHAVPGNSLSSGHLVSNSSVGDSAVELSGNNRIKGNLRSVSGATLGPQTLVEGRILLESNPVTLPTIDLNQYRPDLSDPEVFQGLTSVENALRLDQTAFYQAGGATLTLLDGLTLDGGILFVDGSLEIQGGVHGKGAVIVTGDLQVEGSSQITTDNVAALLAGGDVSLYGSGAHPKDAVVEGLVYSGGRIEAENLTLVGILVSAGTGRATFENCLSLHREEYATVVIEADPNGPTPTSDEELAMAGDDPSTWVDLQFGAVSEAALSDFDASADPRYLSYPVVDTDRDTYLTVLEGDLGRQLTTNEKDSFLPLVDRLIQAVVINGGPSYPPGGTRNIVITPGNTSFGRPVLTGDDFSPHTSASDPSYLFSVDLSDLLSPFDRMRVLAWRTL